MRDLIRWLALRSCRLVGRDDRGAVGVLVAILLTCGVVTGMGAMVIDVGQIYQNRAELQNGADAAALAVAKSCALSNCNTSAAQSYASANARSGVEGISQICGSGTLGGCPLSTGTLTDCPSSPGSGNYVDVHTETQTSSGSHLLPPVFAKTLYGNGNYQGTTVYACAQAEWGAPATATAAPLTVPQCVWNTGTASGSSYTSQFSPSSSADMALQLNGTSGSVATSTSCAGAGTPITAPGGGESFNITPGDTFEVGYDFTIPGNNRPVTVNWTNLQATVNFTCPNGSSGSFTIAMPNYSVTVGDSAWYPTGDQHSPLAYQGEVTAPAACGPGKTMHQSQIATFSGYVTCSQSNTKINYRFHDEDNSSGSWSSTNSVTCGSSSGAPAVFSFTSDGGDCATTFTGSYGPWSGSGFPADCEQALSTSQADRSAILVPVCVTGCVTSSSSYVLAGFAAFVVTGYHLPGFTATDWLNQANNCTGSQYCIDGYFTQCVVPAPGTLGGQNMGATVVKLSG